MGSPFERQRYDVVIAGARCGGASTAMLLARAGLRVLVVDPVGYGRDTLSTHALMRGAVLQLHRWGLLDAVRAAGTPPIDTTVFHYGEESVSIEIREKYGVDRLFAPRRTVLDPILVDAARQAGAEVAYGHAVVDLLRDGEGRVTGARVADHDRVERDVLADLVIGADGIRSRVARILGLTAEYETPHAACSMYGYWPDVPLLGNHWFYHPGVSIGTIPTNADLTCVFALVSQDTFAARGGRSLEELHLDTLRPVSAELAGSVESCAEPVKVRAFAGMKGFLRRATGPGWALVGDAGYFRDPITAHGISDALREAEFLTRAILAGDPRALDAYREERDARVKGLLDVTDRIAALDWDLVSVQEDHLELNRHMNAQVEAQAALGVPIDTLSIS
ncbi:MAG: NAD(P)/FAD-dependent oxidoreductase [Gemmatimonadota bacterium]|nr:NAD(P)/FAD-dependent oxidoreductase [Gemmatimonadota bacterium]